MYAFIPFVSFKRENVFQVARESALSFVPDADITAIHGSVTTPEYGVSFYKQVYFNYKLFIRTS